ncbi:endonuclease domain-containing 1 protein-like [Triplophysa rosa]|uniref:Endonuclease domain-containing 1 protein-like n=1 Tax=Triplophysa rosa TaxID=992332 RepID=A0A9W7WGJ0_TRIRA|nr:endonuclease domain-containing 1 protein-like [Triplophysa rosa]KAI7800762.1 putative endonuclease domain-containing 1 protein-like [Triplophysa rosa]
MQISFILCVLIGTFLHPAQGEVVENFWDSPDCLKFFYKNTVPELGSTQADVVLLCQRFLNTYHFATLYNTYYHIAVYSAYIFEPSNGGGRDKNWYLEPQLINDTWSGEMTDGYKLWRENPGVYLGERQALDEDYTNSGFDRGHLNPNGHHAVPGRNSTFTLTNVVPQNPKLNQNAWRLHESKMTNMFKADCHQAYVLVGAIPSLNNWIIKNNVKRVNIPEYIWNAYCCVDQNGRPVYSGAATAVNTELNVVVEHTLDEMVDFLQQYSDTPVGELFSGQCKA